MNNFLTKVCFPKKLVFMKKGAFEFEVSNFTSFSIRNQFPFGAIPLMVRNLFAQETVLTEDPLYIRVDHFQLKFR